MNIIINDKQNFWLNDNFISLISDISIIPNSKMKFEEKLNTITRFIILTSILGFLFTQNINILISGIFCIFFIILVYYFQKDIQENFINVSTNSNSNFEEQSTKKKNNIPLKKILKEDFYKNDKKNPFGNVLLTEINDTPNRKSAPPSFNLEVEKRNTNNVKEAIQYLNPEIINTNKQLFGDMWQNFELDQSNRVFFSNANTKITNDQGAFAKFLFGDLISAKEGNQFALLQDNYRYNLY
jgi:hypothetical protein